MSGQKAKSGTTGWPALQSMLRRKRSQFRDLVEDLLGRNPLWAVLFVLVMAPVVSQQECGLPPPEYEVGEVATGDIRAANDIELIDEQATLKRREEERQLVRPVYDLVLGPSSNEKTLLAELFEIGRSALRDSGAELDERGLDRLQEILGGSVSRSALKTLARHRFSREAEEAAIKSYLAVMQGRIVAHRDGLPVSGAIAVREVRPGVMLESTFDRLDQIRDLEEARAALRSRLASLLPDWTDEDVSALASVVEPFVHPNFTYNASETERRREKAVASVPQVFMRIPRGRVIVRDGEVFTKESIDLLARIRRQDPSDVDWRVVAGSMILMSMLALFLYRYVEAHRRLFHRVKNLYALVILVVMLVGIGTWVSVFVANSVADQFFVSPFNDPSSYYWAIPAAAGAMLISLLANGRVATVGSAAAAVIYGMALGWDAKAILFALLSSFAAIYGISKYEQRTAVLKSGLLVGMANMLIVFAFMCVENSLSPASNVAFSLLMAGAGGILSALVVSFTLPMLEGLFGVLTDIRLLELSNLDNPLLRRLSLEAPGTYNHSVIVGTLAEQAAEKIVGAHALFCRVAPYYHDIGKMTKPAYFVENMRDGVNRHDRLSPRMSSLIIASHVKEGLRLADEFNIPRQVRDIIPQHHGTRLITFFYRKAKGKENPELRQLHESDYRYPGPKPQTKEAAIIMMADGVEAAARSVDDPTPAKFEEVIRTVSNAIVLDGQLDECDLTFSDLAKIGESFLKTLTAVHHHRISYPGYEFDRAKPRAVEAE